MGRLWEYQAAHHQLPAWLPAYALTMLVAGLVALLGMALADRRKPATSVDPPPRSLLSFDPSGVVWIAGPRATAPELPGRRVPVQRRA